MSGAAQLLTEEHRSSGRVSLSFPGITATEVKSTRLQTDLSSLWWTEDSKTSMKTKILDRPVLVCLRRLTLRPLQQKHCELPRCQMTGKTKHRERYRRGLLRRAELLQGLYISPRLLPPHQALPCWYGNGQSPLCMAQASSASSSSFDWVVTHQQELWNFLYACECMYSKVLICVGGLYAYIQIVCLYVCTFVHLCMYVSVIAWTRNKVLLNLQQRSISS